MTVAPSVLEVVKGSRRWLVPLRTIFGNAQEDLAHEEGNAQSLSFLWRDLAAVGVPHGHSYIRLGSRVLHSTGLGILEERYPELALTVGGAQAGCLVPSRTSFVELRFSVEPAAAAELGTLLDLRVAGEAQYSGKVVVPGFSMTGLGVGDAHAVISENCNAFAASFMRPEWCSPFPNLSRFVEQMRFSRFTSEIGKPGLALRLLGCEEVKGGVVVDWSEGLAWSALPALEKSIGLGFRLETNAARPAPSRLDRLSEDELRATVLSSVVFWRGYNRAGTGSPSTWVSVGPQAFAMGEDAIQEKDLIKYLKRHRASQRLVGLMVGVRASDLESIATFFRSVARSTGSQLAAEIGQPFGPTELALALSFGKLLRRYPAPVLPEICETCGFRYMDAKVFRYHDRFHERPLLANMVEWKSG